MAAERESRSIRNWETRVAAGLAWSLGFACASQATPRALEQPDAVGPTRAPETRGDDPRPANPEPPPEPPSPETPAPRATPPPEPRTARFVALPVPGFLDAVVALPEGAVRQEPVLLATHGAGGGPEDHCAAWRRQLGARGVVVCPRGAMINRIEGPRAGFYYPDHHALGREVLATVEALRTEFADRIDGDTMLYAGYSQGATMGALVLPDHADLFPRAVLVEGGFSEWNLSAARRFAEHGGQRVLFVCGLKRCKAGADRSAFSLRHADLDVQTRLAAGAGHTYLGSVAQEIAEGLSWLVDGDPRWH